MDQLERAHKLLQSARKLFESGDLTGVAGLAYQAIEAGIMHLSSIQASGPAHAQKQRKAEGLLNMSRNALKELWYARNIDFYGNERLGGEPKELSPERIKASLINAEKMIKQVKELSEKK